MRVEEVGDVQLGRQRSPKNRSANYPTKYLRAANITERGLDLTDLLEMDFKPDEQERYRLESGDIILSEASGSASQVGKPAIWTGELPLCCFQNTVIRLRPKHADPKYLLWVFTHFYRNGIFARVAAGVGINHLSAAKFKQLEIPVPPLDEQRRIVAEIEKQFTRLDAGVAALRRTQANLKRYRAAVLKAACEGHLVPTEAELARKTGTDFESGASLLQRILNERRKNWTTGRGKYIEPTAQDTSKLPSLPEGWAWARLEQLGFCLGGLTKNPKRAQLPKQLPYLRVANVYANELRLAEIEYIGVADSEFEKLLLRASDLLVVEGNGSKDQIGRLAIWDGSIEPCVHQNHLIKVRLVDPRMPKWVLYWLQSPVGRRFVELVASSTSGLYTLSVNKVGNLPIALPPLAEQMRVVAEVEHRLSIINKLETAVATNIARATRLRQSTLQNTIPA